MQAATNTFKLSKRIQRLQESATIKMAALSRELRAEGKDIIDLSLGEPDFDTPVHICEAAKQAIDQGYTHYTPVPGFPDLLDAISFKFKRDNQLDYKREQIVVSTGAKQSLANVVLSLVNPGEEVILLAPYWVSYGAITDVAEGKRIEVPTTIENDFKVSPEQLDQAINERTRLVIFNSPSNPTGSIYTREEMAALADVLERYPNVFIIADEIYEYINFVSTHESLATFGNIRDRVITVNGLSKGFAMTGWRIGYIGAPKWIAKACTKMQGQFTSGANSVAQRAAIAALTGDMAPTELMRNAFLKRRDMLRGLLNEIPGIKNNNPQGAFYFFMDVSNYFGKSAGSDTIVNADDLAMYLIKEANVSVVTGSAFGDPRGLRLSYAASEEILTQAVDRVGTALSKLH